MEKAFLEYANFGKYAPIVSGSLLPTKFGNIIYSCEEYPLDRYKIRSLGMWTRLAQVLPVNFRNQLEEKNNQMIFLLNSYLMSYLIGIVALLTGVISICSYILFGISYRGAYLLGLYNNALAIKMTLQTIAIEKSIDYLFIGVLMLIFGYLLYYLALPVAEGFGTLVRTAYDLYRFDLLRQLSQEIPPNNEEEGRLWNRLSQLFIAGRNYTAIPLNFSYSVPNDLSGNLGVEIGKEKKSKNSAKKKKKKNK